MAAELSAIDVKRLAHPGGKRNVLYSVGGVPSLHLQLSPKDGRSWVLRAKVGAVRRDIGLGGFLMPVFIDIMMDNPNENWGKPFYPVVE